MEVTTKVYGTFQRESEHPFLVQNSEIVQMVEYTNGYTGVQSVEKPHFKICFLSSGRLWMLKVALLGYRSYNHLITQQTLPLPKEQQE